MKSGAGDLGLCHVRLGGEIGGERFGERARVRARGLRLPGVDHRGVGREIAMGGVARRLDHETGEVEVLLAVRPAAIRFSIRPPTRAWKSAKTFIHSAACAERARPVSAPAGVADPAATAEPHAPEHGPPQTARV